MNSIHYLFKAIPWLGFFAAITISWIYYLRARNKERIALIEKGVDVSEIYSTPIQPIKFPWLKLGLVILGISIGISIVIVLILLYPDSELASVGAGVSVIVSGFLFGSIAMIIAHYIDKPKR